MREASTWNTCWAYDPLFLIKSLNMAPWSRNMLESAPNMKRVFDLFYCILISALWWFRVWNSVKDYRSGGWVYGLLFWTSRIECGLSLLRLTQTEPCEFMDDHAVPKFLPSENDEVTNRPCVVPAGSSFRSSPSYTLINTDYKYCLLNCYTYYVL